MCREYETSDVFKCGFVSPTILQFVGEDHHSFVKTQVFIYFSVQKLEYWKRYRSVLQVADEC